MFFPLRHHHILVFSFCSSLCTSVTLAGKLSLLKVTFCSIVLHTEAIGNKGRFFSEASLLGLPKSPFSLCVLLAFLRDKEKGDGKKERVEEMKRKIRNKTERRREKEKNLVSITNAPNLLSPGSLEFFLTSSFKTPFSKKSHLC